MSQACLSGHVPVYTFSFTRLHRGRLPACLSAVSGSRMPSCRETSPPFLCLQPYLALDQVRLPPRRPCTTCAERARTKLPGPRPRLITDTLGACRAVRLTSLSQPQHALADTRMMTCRRVLTGRASTPLAVPSTPAWISWCVHTPRIPGRALSPARTVRTLINLNMGACTCMQVQQRHQILYTQVNMLAVFRWVGSGVLVACLLEPAKQ